MTREEYLWCVAMFIAGQLLHLFLNKIPALQKRAKASNYQFTLKDYWKEEWYIIIGTQIFGAMVVIGIDEITTWKPAVIDAVKWFFAGIGYFFSSVIISKLGQYEKKLLNVIDLKTNTADSYVATNEKGAPIDMVKNAPGESKTQ